MSRVGLAWCLLFFNVLGSGTPSALRIPHSVMQVLTQGALGLALFLALTVNPRIRVRPNLLLSLYSLLAILSLMMSFRFVGLGTDYRAVRLAVFIAVLWLLTPWWGEGDHVLLRNQLRFLGLILASVALGAVVDHHRAFTGGRLQDVIWVIPPTQTAHYAVELLCLTTLLSICGLVRRRPALLVILPSLTILLLTPGLRARPSLARLQDCSSPRSAFSPPADGSAGYSQPPSS